MTWQLEQSEDGIYAIDWEVVRTIVRSYYYAKQLSRARIRTEKIDADPSWWDRAWGWEPLVMQNLEVDWSSAREQIELETFVRLNELRNTAQQSVREVTRILGGMLRSTRRKKNQFQRKQQGVSERNMGKIEYAADKFDSRLDTAKFIRDTSGSSFMICASFLSGGTALLAMGGGSAYQGWGKYEDSGRRNWQAGAMKAFTTFGFAYISLGNPDMKTGAKYGLVVLKAATETGQALVEGKAFSEALTKGALKLTGPLIEKVSKSPIVAKLLSRATIPITVEGEAIATPELLRKQVVKLAEMSRDKLGSQAIRKYLREVRADSPQGPEPVVELTPADRAMLHNQELLDFAIINMQKGVPATWLVFGPHSE